MVFSFANAKSKKQERYEYGYFSILSFHLLVPTTPASSTSPILTISFTQQSEERRFHLVLVTAYNALAGRSPLVGLKTDRRILPRAGFSDAMAIGISCDLQPASFPITQSIRGTSDSVSRLFRS